MAILLRRRLAVPPLTAIGYQVSGFKQGKIFRFPGINVVWLTG